MERTEGIILHSLNYQDYDLILTVFTLDKGMLKFLYKGGNSHKRRSGAVVAPFTRVEVVYSQGKSELFSLLEVTTLQRYPELSQTIDNLEAACVIAKAILKTQLVAKPADLLYKLLVSYLSKIHTFSNPKILMTSFLLKLLRHEGLLNQQGHCASCKIALDECLWDGLDYFCSEHAPTYAIAFSNEEAKIVYILSYSRSFEQMQSLVIPETFSTKILQAFHLALE